MKTISYLLSLLAIFLTPTTGLIITMIVFIMADTLFGIYASIKMDGMKSFKSTKLFNVVIKTFFYCSTIIMAFTLDKYIFDGSVAGIAFLLSKLMTGLWVYIEIKSIDETSMKIGNRSFWVILREMVNKLKSLKKDLNEVGQ